MSNRPRPDHESKERRKIEGAERQEHWDSLTPLQKVQDLDRRLGNSVGAKRQREKLPSPLEFASKSEERRVNIMKGAKS